MVIAEKKTIEVFLRKNAFLHLYEIGDLDDFFWPNSTWYCLKENDVLMSLCLLYDSGFGLPVFLAFHDEKAMAAATGKSASTPDESSLMKLLNDLSNKATAGPVVLRLESESKTHLGVSSVLPNRFYAHLSPGLQKDLQPAFRGQFHGLHDKMGLQNSQALESFRSSDSFQLLESDLEEIKGLYQESYPGNWFDARMLATGQYVGIRSGGKLASIAGVHVYSKEYRVAALGNITTHPDFRGRGLAAKVVACLCLELLKTVDLIGLNVKSDNKAAIACYQKLGFDRITSYEEYVFVRA